MAPEPVRRERLWVAGFALLAFAIAVLAPLGGPTHPDLAKAFAGVWPDHEIFFGARLPRVLLALLAGAALATGGVLFQALLRDALATPFTLGISSGASLGAVIAITTGLERLAGMPGVWAAAFLGSALTLALVLAVASSGARLSSFTLLLSGVAINSIAMALIMLLHNLADFGQSFAIVRWVVGGIDAISYPALAALAAIVCGTSFFLWRQARQWDLLTAGEEWAAARGASPRRLLLIGYLAGSLLAASVTAFTGPIGFVGLIVPHALRLRFGAGHRLLLPLAFFGGASFLALCDLAARTVLAPAEIPAGVVTALAGGPAFIMMLRGRRRSLWL